MKRARVVEVDELGNEIEFHSGRLLVNGSPIPYDRIELEVGEDGGLYITWSVSSSRKSGPRWSWDEVRTK